MKDAHTHDQVQQVWNETTKTWGKKTIPVTQFESVRFDKETTKRTGIHTLILTDKYGNETKKLIPTKEQRNIWKKKKTL